MGKISSNIEIAAQYIQQGELVAFPTETVYGLGADALNTKAVAKIFKTKERPTFNPLIVHISDIADLQKLFVEVNDALLELVKHFWPGPLTIVAKKQKTVPDIVTGGLDTVAVRMPANETAQALLKAAKTPIAAPSANRFGMLSPTSPEHVKKQLPQLACILKGELPKVGIESTVIELQEGKFKILRPGSITEDDLLKVIPQSLDTTDTTKLKSPGLLKSHYSPKKPLYLLGEQPANQNDLKYGLLSLTGVTGRAEYHLVEVLSPSGDLGEAAANFFEALHRLEDSDVDIILAEPVPENGIGIAIMDRLKKAAYQYQNDEE